MSNKEQVVKEKMISLFRRYNMEGSMTQMFVCRYFDTKDINDLKVLERAKLNPQLKTELTDLLRNYFRSTIKVGNTKVTAPEVPVQEQPKEIVIKSKVTKNPADVQADLKRILDQFQKKL